MKYFTVSLLLFLITGVFCQGQKPYTKMNNLDKEYFQKILLPIFQPTPIDEETKNQFWNFINNYDAKEVVTDFTEFGNNLLSIGYQYNLMFYEDALISLKSNSFYKSKEREEFENSVLKNNKDRVIKNDILLNNIANKTPVPYNGDSIIFTMEIIQYILDNYSQSFDVIANNIKYVFSESKNLMNDVNFHFSKGYYYSLEGNDSLALLNYTTCLKLKPTYSEALNNRGCIFNNWQEFEKALNDFNSAIKINPKYSEAYLNRGNSYYKLGNIERALENYTIAIKYNPNLQQAYLNRAKAKIKMDLIEKACKDFVKAKSLGEIDEEVNEFFINKCNK